MIRRTLLAAGWLWLAVSSADARDIFVNNTAGDDAATGHDPTTIEASRGPVRSIGRALVLAYPADRIVLAKTDQPYRESITFSGPKHTGFFSSPVILDGGDAILDGAKRIDPFDWESYEGDVFRYLPSPMTYVPLSLQGRPLVEVRPAGGATATTPRELKPREWCRYDRHIYFRVDKGTNIGDYELSIPGSDVGITLYKVQHVVIANLVVQNFRLDGINVADARDCLLVNVVGRGNGRSGIAITGPSQAIVEGCRLGANGAAQLYLSGWSTTEAVESTLFPSELAPALYRGPHVKLKLDDETTKSVNETPAETNTVEPEPAAPVGPRPASGEPAMEETAPEAESPADADAPAEMAAPADAEAAPALEAPASAKDAASEDESAIPAPTSEDAAEADAPKTDAEGEASATDF
ncbi:MAG TPA: right-handed parallel beta-helix repeat-containing protein [Pirellulales bacterium]